ncbi:hypothetical protein E2C01_063728 [Portunus trituberculatus]|uniref:Uncharacterized protein n=1 Tax=Portunus trituberculatus TaxID=210409 RepID=A0A5B7HEG0_PORTR|nr:hypothetical protein [Portunus trituberculatus]
MTITSGSTVIRMPNRTSSTIITHYGRRIWCAFLYFFQGTSAGQTSCQDEAFLGHTVR